jgi:hypothetical protein
MDARSPTFGPNGAVIAVARRIAFAGDGTPKHHLAWRARNGGPSMTVGWTRLGIVIAGGVSASLVVFVLGALLSNAAGPQKPDMSQAKSGPLEPTRDALPRRVTARKTDRLLPAGEPKYYPLKNIVAEAQEANKRDRAVRSDLLGKSQVQTGYGWPGAPVEPYPHAWPDAPVGFEARTAITMRAKTAPQATGGNNWNERGIVMKKGDTLSAILRDLGATPEEIKAIAAMLGPRGRDGNLKEGQKIRVLLSPAPRSQRLQPVRVTLVGETAIEAVVALSDLGKYVAVDVQSAETLVADADEDNGAGMRHYQKAEMMVLPPTMPEAEKLLIAAVEKARAAYAADANEMAQGAARPARAKEICAALKDLGVSNWLGEVETLSSNSDGLGVLSVRIANGISIKTWNNTISDVENRTLIDPETAVFKRAAILTKGQKV